MAKAPPPAAPAPAEDPEPVKPLRWTDKDPAVPVLILQAVSGTRQSPALLVELDGATQWLKSGGYCTRGRVAVIRPLSPDLRLHESLLWEEGGGKTTGVARIGQKPVAPGPAVAPAPAAPFYQSPPAFIPPPNL